MALADTRSHYPEAGASLSRIARSTQSFSTSGSLKHFLRGSFEGSINAHKLKLVDSERAVLDVAKKGDGRPIDSECHG